MLTDYVQTITYGDELFEKLNKIHNPKKIEKLLQKKNNLMKMHETLTKKQRDDDLLPYDDKPQIGGFNTVDNYQN